MKNPIFHLKHGDMKTKEISKDQLGWRYEVIMGELKSCIDWNHNLKLYKLIYLHEVIKIMIY
jgi:hypothetical protein